MSDTTTATQNTPPDWETQTKDLLCPLCGYNLRGLTEGRCPECGFAFTWQELLDAEKNKHLYLFEHGKGGNIKAFWKTYWRTCRPRRFWTDLNPAQPIVLFRLLLYWFLACTLATGFVWCGRVDGAVKLSRESFKYRAFERNRPTIWTPASGWRLMTKPELDDHAPLPWQLGFYRRVFLTAQIGQLDLCGYPIEVVLWIILASWPWLTLSSLMIFQLSMRKERVRFVQLLRTVIYASDFGLLAGIFLFAMSFQTLFPASGWLIMVFVFVCAEITIYRLTIAFNQYLRVHRPLATVLASQLISFLIVFVVLVPIADFSRRV